MFAGFEEEDVVAGVQFGEGVKRAVVVVVGFGVEFGVSFCVWEEGGEVVEEVSLSAGSVSGWGSGMRTGQRDDLPMGDAAGCEHKYAVA